MQVVRVKEVRWIVECGDVLVWAVQLHRSSLVYYFGRPVSYVMRPRPPLVCGLMQQDYNLTSWSLSNLTVTYCFDQVNLQQIPLHWPSMSLAPGPNIHSLIGAPAAARCVGQVHNNPIALNVLTDISLGQDIGELLLCIVFNLQYLLE